MVNFGNLNSFHRNFSFRNRPSHSKVTVTKVKVSDFRAEQTAHWSTHGLVDRRYTMGTDCEEGSKSSFY